MIATLLLAPPALGYVLVGRILNERSVVARIVVGYALGASIYVFLVNLLLNFVPITLATYATLVCSLLLAALVGRQMPGGSRPRKGLPSVAAVLIGILAAAALLDALIRQLRLRDDDFAVHWPLMASLLKGSFPPQNPHFPNLPYAGHYGSDLRIASLSVLVGGNFRDLRYFLVTLDHVVAVVLLYLLIRRFLRSPLAAVLGTMATYLGVHSEIRTGLLETFENNNSLVYLLLFLNLYLLALCVVRMRRPALLALSAVSVGTYSVVYETHFCILLAACVPTLVIVAFQSGRRRSWLLVGGLALFLMAGALAAVQGGTITDVVRRRVVERSRSQQTEDVIGLSQQINIRVRKAGLILTSYQGDEYPLWSRRTLEEAGLPISVLPLCLVVFLIRRNHLGTLFAFMGSLALLVPATVDFGRYNADCFRFFFLGGVCAACSLGMALAYLAPWAERVIRLPRALVVSIMLAPGGWLVAPSFTKAWDNFGGFLREPDVHYWDSRDWAVNWNSMCRSVDLKAAAAVRPLAKAGDRMLTTLNVQMGRARSTATLNRESVTASFAGLYIVGTGLHIEGDEHFSMLKSSYESASLTKIAFLNTGDVSLLRPLGIRFLYVDPTSLGEETIETLRKNPELQLLQEIRAGLEGASLYAVRAEPLDRGDPSLEPFSIREISLPTVLRPAEFYPLQLEVETRQSLGPYHPLVSYRVLHGDKRMNLNDEVPQRIHFERFGERVWRGQLSFVAPYEAGPYELQLWQSTAAGQKQVPDGSGGTFRRPIVVTDAGDRP